MTLNTLDTATTPSLTTSTTTTQPQPPPTKSKDVYIPTNKDSIIMSMRDEDYTLISWPQARETITSNHLENLTRLPSQLRKYLAWCQKVREEFGSVQNYILKERVKWEVLEPKCERVFGCDEDVKILVNDWPYGLEPGIMHIVVWTKTPIPVDPSTGDLTVESRESINNFVKEKFVDGLGLEDDRVLWFKNWAALQSIRTVEHFHVFVNTQGVKGGEELVRTIAK